MGLRNSAALLAVALISCFSPISLQAAPKLRLANSVIGPVWVAPGSTGGTQTAEAYNAGDGNLSLAVTSSASWAAASTGASKTCSSLSGFTGTCIPIAITMNTSSLSAGVYTAIVTVSDPNAVDAPQTITVTVRVASGVDMYVAPGTSRAVKFATTSRGTPNATGGNWLALTLDSVGSFQFSFPYSVRMSPAASLAEGNYTGSVSITGAQNVADNKTIPVTMRVSKQPIAEASSDIVRVRLAQGAASTYWDVYLNNVGQGSLTQQGATAKGGAWISTAQYPPNLTRITLDPGSLAPGVYSGSVDIASNAVNGTVTVPAEFEVVAKGAPQAYYGGIVDNAVFLSGQPVGRGDIVALFGEQFSATPGASDKLPLSTQVGGVQVMMNGKAAPIFYAGGGQINFQVPYDAPLGTNLVQVVRDGTAGNTISVTVADRAPRLLPFLYGAYAAATNADASLPMPVGTYSTSVWQYGTHPAHPGDWLTFYAIGLGPIQGAAVPAGTAAPSDPLPRLSETPTVRFGLLIQAASAVPAYAGLSPGFAGLYQVNVQVPADAPKGDVDVTLLFSTGVSNAVKIAIE